MPTTNSRGGTRTAHSALLALLFALFSMTTASGHAEDTDNLDEILSGFGEEEPLEGKMDEAVPPPGEPFPWNLTGSLVVGSSINLRSHRSSSGTDYGGLSRLRTRLNLQSDLELPGDWKLRVAGFGFYDWAYLIRGRGDYTGEVRDEYEWEMDFQEVWIRGSLLENLDLKLGRQIVNWGRSDTIRVLDVLNPLDNREPGLADIEDTRRPVTMARLDYYLDCWALTAIAIPEIRFDLNPPFGSDFFPETFARGLFPDSQAAISAFDIDPFLTASLVAEMDEERPDRFSKQLDVGLALTGIFPRWDISFHFARFWRDATYLEPGLPSSLQDPLWGIRLAHSRVTMLGAGANYTSGSWLLKAELAFLKGLDYTVTSELRTPLGVFLIPTGTVERSRWDAMVGVEYYGIHDTMIALEVANRHIHHFRGDMRAFFARRNAVEVALRATADFLRDRLHVTGVAFAIGPWAKDGSVLRLQVDYDLRDALVLTGGVLLFQKGDLPPFDSIWKNDRLFLQVKWSF